VTPQQQTPTRDPKFGRGRSKGRGNAQGPGLEAGKGLCSVGSQKSKVREENVVEKKKAQKKQKGGQVGEKHHDLRNPALFVVAWGGERGQKKAKRKGRYGVEVTCGNTYYKGLWDGKKLRNSLRQRVNKTFGQLGRGRARCGLGPSAVCMKGENGKRPSGKGRGAKKL